MKDNHKKYYVRLRITVEANWDYVSYDDSIKHLVEHQEALFKNLPDKFNLVELIPHMIPYEYDKEEVL